MFIDIHAHAYRIPFMQLDGVPPWPRPGDLLPYYDRIGVEKAVLLPIVAPESYMPQTNEEIIEAAQRFTGRFIPFCNIHPQIRGSNPHFPIEKLLAKYVDAGCRGVGEVMVNRSFLDPLMRNLFRAVNELKLPLTFHLSSTPLAGYGIADDPGLPGLDRTLSTYPDIKFLGHSSPFWAEISVLELPGDRAGLPRGKVREGAIPKLMRKHPNLYGDLSARSGANALMRDEEYAVRFLTEFQDRLFFGLDICSIPVPDFHEQLPAFLKRLLAEKKITQVVFDKIARKNAERLLGL